MTMSQTPRDWRDTTFGPGITIPNSNECAALKCPFPINLQERDSIPTEYTNGAYHYVTRQRITDAVQAPWTSYYTTLRGAPLAIANFGGVWFEVKRWKNKFIAIRPTRAILEVKHLPYRGMNLQSLVDSREPTPAELQHSRPPSHTDSKICSKPKHDEGIRECSSTARAKDPCHPKGTRDDPFGIWDLPKDMGKAAQGG
jgi:hypothetical protein